MAETTRHLLGGLKKSFLRRLIFSICKNLLKEFYIFNLFYFPGQKKKSDLVVMLAAVRKYHSFFLVTAGYANLRVIKIKYAGVITTDKKLVIVISYRKRTNKHPVSEKRFFFQSERDIFLIF